MFTSAGTSVPNTPPTSSPSQEPLEIIQTTGTSSVDDQNIFSNFLEIKQKNETLKSNVYNQFWKQTSTSQHRLLSTFDSEKGKIQMAFL